MNRYISLLRGINVSGQKKILMKDLKALYESLSFDRVVTYIQSGNVVFESPEDDDIAIANKIETTIQKELNYSVPVIIRNHSEWRNIINKNPFLAHGDSAESSINPKLLYVTFLRETPTDLSIFEESTYTHKDDQSVLLGREIFVHCPAGYGRTKLNNNFFEKKLKVIATARNWNTVLKLNNLLSL